MGTSESVRDPQVRSNLMSGTRGRAGTVEQLLELVVVMARLRLVGGGWLVESTGAQLFWARIKDIKAILRYKNFKSADPAQF